MTINYEKESGLTFKCDFKGTVLEYAMMWLNLTNNARVHNKIFRQIKNTESNIIYVTVDSYYKEETEEYLKSLELEILSITDCKVIIPIVDYDYFCEYIFASVEAEF